MTVSLSWTNPPDADLFGIRLYVELDGDTLEAVPYYGRATDEDTPPVIVPGGRETVTFTVPCRSSPHTYHFWVRPFDRSGNLAGYSNIVEVTR